VCAYRSGCKLDLHRDAPLPAGTSVRPLIVAQAFLTLSEVLGHLDLLIAEGLVAEDCSRQPVRFVRT
jgi:hypothetical protein